MPGNLLLVVGAAWGFGFQRATVVRQRLHRRHVVSPPESDLVSTKADSIEEAYIQNPWYHDGDKPMPAYSLAATNFVRQGSTLVVQALERLGIVASDPLRPPDCLQLVLDNEDVAEAERRREAGGGRIEANPVARGLYDAGCAILDNVFDGRPIQRFWFLETIARIPYFSYVSMLHLYESLGWWRATELRKVHYAEEYNELHHLLILEALGGNAQWSDRFLGYHAAIVYYWAIIAVYVFSPRTAYSFMELLEAHAVDTYSTFVRANRARLAALPPPAVARSYYVEGDLYMFDDFQLKPPGSRRPPCDTLLDVFMNICEDEGEHVKTMRACQEYCVSGRPIVSPHIDASSQESFQDFLQNRPDDKKRKQWRQWAAEMNRPKHDDS